MFVFLAPRFQIDESEVICEINKARCEIQAVGSRDVKDDVLCVNE